MDLRLTFLTFIKMLTADSDTQPVVQTTYGKIQGQILSTVQEPHLKYYAFRGIPYAKPPLEELRFQV
jgi:carboxylesterase type B